MNELQEWIGFCSPIGVLFCCCIYRKEKSADPRVFFFFWFLRSFPYDREHSRFGWTQKKRIFIRCVDDTLLFITVWGCGVLARMDEIAECTVIVQGFGTALYSTVPRDSLDHSNGSGFFSSFLPTRSVKNIRYNIKNTHHDKTTTCPIVILR